MEEKGKGEGRGRCMLMWSWTVFRLCSWQNLHGSASPICLLVPRRSEGEWDRKRGLRGVCSLFAGSDLSICSEPNHSTSVHPSQRPAGVGPHLDDPLPAAVAVVQVQEVRVWIQAVLTCGIHTEKAVGRVFCSRVSSSGKNSSRPQF